MAGPAVLPVCRARAARRRALLAVLVVAAATPLAACGERAAPTTPVLTSDEPLVVLPGGADSLDTFHGTLLMRTVGGRMLPVVAAAVPRDTIYITADTLRFDGHGHATELTAFREIQRPPGTATALVAEAESELDMVLQVDRIRGVSYLLLKECPELGNPLCPVAMARIDAGTLSIVRPAGDQAVYALMQER